MSMLLGPGGEFSFVMIGAALPGGLVDRALATTLAAAVAISMLAIPALAKLGQRIGSAPRPQAGAAPEETPLGYEDGRVIIVGYGRVGALIGDMLNVHKIPFIAVDSDARLVARARAAGKRVYYGDASRPNYLRGCGVETARAVVVTMDSPSGNEAVVATTRSLRQDVTLVARAATPPTPARSTSLGVTDAVPEAIEASLQLSEAVLVDIGVPMGFAIASVHEKREEYRKVLLAAGARERFRSTRKSGRA
jgi:monovalent cation:H+ antiporter-2, CPA2 family